MDARISKRFVAKSQVEAREKSQPGKPRKSEKQEKRGKRARVDDARSGAAVHHERSTQLKSIPDDEAGVY